MRPVRAALLGTAYLGSLLLGASVGLAALAVHRAGLGWLALAVVGSLAGAWVLRDTAHPRLCSAYCLGWTVVFGIALTGRPEGDYALAGDAVGYTLTGTALVVVMLGVTALPGRRRPRT